MDARRWRRQDARSAPREPLDHRARRPAGAARRRSSPSSCGTTCRLPARASLAGIGRARSPSPSASPSPQRAEHARLPAGRLARALRHRPRARPAVGADGAAHGDPGAVIVLLHAIAHRLGRARAALPRALPVPAHGHQRRLPDRRRLQPLRLLRGPADRLLRADAARRRADRHACGPPVRRDEPRRLHAVPLRAGHCSTAHRHAQHRRHRREAGRAARRRRGARPRLRRAPHARLRGQGRALSRCSSGCPAPTPTPPRRSPRSSPS